MQNHHHKRYEENESKSKLANFLGMESFEFRYISCGATFVFAAMRKDIRLQQDRDRLAASAQYIQINVRRSVSE